MPFPHAKFGEILLRKRQGLQLVPGLPADTADSPSLSSSHMGAVTVHHCSHEPDLVGAGLLYHIRSTVQPPTLLANGFRCGQKIFQGSMVCPDDYGSSQKMLSILLETEHHT